MEGQILPSDAAGVLMGGAMGAGIGAGIGALVGLASGHRPSRSFTVAP